MKRSPTKAAQAIEITARDHHQHHRNNFWYVGVALLIIVGLYLGFVVRDYLLMAVALTVGIAIYRVAHLPNATRKIRLTEHGVDWGGQFIGYHHFRAFWLAEVDERVVIYLERLNLQATISFVCGPSEVEEAVPYLSRHLPWHHHKTEPFGERFGRWLKI